MSFQNQLYQSSLVVHYFADDTANTLGTIESVISHELKLLVQWLRSDKLYSNETKTELIIFRSLWNHLTREPDIGTNYKLKLHSHIKYFDILIDEILSWNKQIDEISVQS